MAGDWLMIEMSPFAIRQPSSGTDSVLRLAEPRKGRLDEGTTSRAIARDHRASDDAAGLVPHRSRCYTPVVSASCFGSRRRCHTPLSRRRRHL